MQTDWIPLVTRKESPLWVSLVCLGGDSIYFGRALSWDFGIKNYKYENLTHSIAVSDAVELQRHIQEHSSTGDFFQDYLDRCVVATTTLDQVADEIRAEYTTRSKEAVSNQDLARTFERFCEAVQGAMPFLASLVLVQDRLEGTLRMQIGETLGDDPKSTRVAEVLSSCVVAPNDTNVVLESRNLLRLASDLEATGINRNDLEGQPNTVLSRLEERLPGFLEMLHEHISKYGWLRTFTYFGEPFSEAEILQRLQTLLEHGECASRLNAAEIRHNNELKHSRQRAQTLFGDSPLTSLLELAGQYLYWRFERIDVHFRSEVRVRPLELKIASAIGLPRDQLVQCTYNEIANYLQGNESALPSKATLNERMERGFNCYVEDGRFFITGRATPSQSDQVGATEEVYSFPLNGTTACPGKVSGIARLLLSADDIHKLSEGEILVTTMTTPDLMLAIEKCSAIVTDEGGLLCHAAIISRELQIPCVIGTGTATKAISDGDHIIVDAEQHEGVVQLCNSDSP